MKIIAIGMNYSLHCYELHAGEALPQEPVIFMKPDSALLKDSKPFFIPDFCEQVDYETEMVVRICRLGKNISERFAHRYYDAVTVGIDFTARDLQRKFRAEGKPWELCKGFDSSAAIGDWVPVEKLGDIQKVNFHLNIDGKTVQQGNTADMLFSVDQIIAYVSRFCTLKIGDLLFTGTPVGVGPVQIGNHQLELIPEIEHVAQQVDGRCPMLDTVQKIHQPALLRTPVCNGPRTQVRIRKKIYILHRIHKPFLTKILIPVLPPRSSYPCPIPVQRPD